MATSRRPADLAGWLALLETLHPKPIAMGLDRVRAVLDRMRIAIDCPVITVAGTNGKGSTTAFCDAMLRAAGYRTGRYMSPHLARYNERVALDGEPAGDEALVEAFHAVEDARTAVEPATPLTYFEMGTLAALWLFARAKPEALVLEVGLGGRLDAVNVVDADVAVLTSVDLDHMEFLGPTREDIGREKAGIFRPGRPAVCGERAPPASVLAHAEAIGARLLLIGRDYDGIVQGTQWRYRGPGGDRHGLPVPALRGDYQVGNAATAMAALGCLRDRLPVDAGAIRDALVRIELPGRFQSLPGRPAIVLDVAHNPHAARALAATLGTMGFHPRTVAVFAMLADKDIDGVIAPLAVRVDRWEVATLPGPRGAPASLLRDRLLAAGVAPSAIRMHDDPQSAYESAAAEAGEADRIVVFGSFLTVAAALARGRPPAGR
ncbi:MAG TPA: bifunctional tetrahydrofolate synthase/dihydrofolate synthase [Casimicrobiaceae bacterium]|nr:bifunctional tetrahydrofolate synthase/dihydrofolate synthase [Casimicrobiaceae bacterium]